MSDFLPKAVRDGLRAAQRDAERRKSRLHIDLDGERLRILRMWDTGFAVEVEDAPRLRGLVDLYDGGRHLYQCLIVAVTEEDGEMRYEFKRRTAASDNAPLDFVRPDNAPFGYLPSS